MQAVVVAMESSEVTVRFPDEGARTAPKASHAIISDADGDYFAEVIESSQGTMRLKKMWSDRREYFRVDSVFPLELRRSTQDPSVLRAHLVSGHGVLLGADETADDSISPRLWKMLVDINAKLEAILEMERLQQEGFSRMGDRRVNVCATGLRVLWPERFEVNCLVEIRMLLPSYPPVGLVLYGAVVRVDEQDGGQFDTALHFLAMDEEVREEIIRYTLQCEREILRQQRAKRETDG